METLFSFVRPTHLGKHKTRQSHLFSSLPYTLFLLTATVVYTDTAFAQFGGFSPQIIYWFIGVILAGVIVLMLGLGSLYLVYKHIHLAPELREKQILPLLFKLFFMNIPYIGVAFALAFNLLIESKPKNILLFLFALVILPPLGSVLLLKYRNIPATVGYYFLYLAVAIVLLVSFPFFKKSIVAFYNLPVFGSLVKNNFSPLLISIFNNNDSLTDFLLKWQIGLEWRDGYDRTPLIIATEQGDLDLAKRLIQNGANIHSTTVNNYSSAYSEWTALHVAAFLGNTEIMALLVENGAHIETTSKQGFTPLMIAIEYNHQKMVDDLLARGAHADVRTPYRGNSTLALAANNNNLDLIKQLISHGATLDPDIFVYVRPSSSIRSFFDEYLGDLEKFSGKYIGSVSFQDGKRGTIDLFMDLKWHVRGGFEGDLEVKVYDEVGSTLLDFGEHGSLMERIATKLDKKENARLLILRADEVLFTLFLSENKLLLFNVDENKKIKGSYYSSGNKLPSGKGIFSLNKTSDDY